MAMTAKSPTRFGSVIVKLFIATEAGWGYDAARHRLPSKLSTVIGEPGHTKPRAARVGLGRGDCGLFWVRASQYIDRRAANVSNNR